MSHVADPPPTPAVQASRRSTVPTAAGDDDRIPRVFLAAADLTILAIALLAAQYYAPATQRLFLAGGVLEGWLPGIFPIPAVPTPAPEFPPLTEVVWLFASTAPATVLVMELVGGYRRLLPQSAVRLVTNAVVAQTVAISFGALILFALKLSTSSRVITFTYALLSALGLIAYRGAIWGYQRQRRRTGVYAKNVLVVGQARGVEWIAHHFARHVQDNEFRLFGWLSVPRSSIHTPERRIDDDKRHIPLPRLGTVDDLDDLLVHHPVHEVIAVQAGEDRQRLQKIVDVCDYFRVRLHVVPEALLVGNLRDLSIAFHNDPLRLPEIVLSPPYLDADSLFVKRLMDVTISATLLVLLAPLLLAVAVAIKITTPHLPVLYPWKVVGLNGRRFTGYKFTTMVAEADAQKQDLLSLNEMTGPVFKVKNDPRTTPLGRFLRKYSLNELPQLWSVLKGDMSLVGPRPALRHELERYELWHKRKLTVKPGITCLWQVSGRNRISDFDEWVRLDLEYINQWSIRLDLRILARTFWTVLSGSGS